jgi:hypothetical protein
MAFPVTIQGIVPLPALTRVQREAACPHPQVWPDQVVATFP